MQNSRNGEGRSHKRSKYTIRKVNGSTDTINKSTGDAASNILAEIVNSTSSAGSTFDSCSVKKPRANGPPAESTAAEMTAMTAMSANDHSNVESALQNNTIAGSLPPTEHVHWKRLVLDEAGSGLENVLEALKTQNTECVAATIPGMCPALMNIEPIFLRIFIGIGMNYAHSISTSLASAIDIEKEKL